MMLNPKMKLISKTLPVILLLFAACTRPADPESLIERINAKEVELQGYIQNALAGEQMLPQIKGTAGELAELLGELSDEFPDHEFAAEAMMRRGMILAEILDDYPAAAVQFHAVHEKHPQSIFSEHALFLAGYTMAEMTDDTTMARQYYREFLDAYPQSEMAPSVAIELENLGKIPTIPSH
jgi:hypothetical protein